MYLNILTNGTADNHLAREGVTPNGEFLCGKRYRRNASLHVFTVRDDGFAPGVLNQCQGCVQATAAQAVTIEPGFSFTHPTQGVCRVVSTGNADRVRYEFGNTDGWAPRHAVTTRSAIRNLLAAGVLAAV